MILSKKTNLDGLPSALKRYPNWVCWKLVQKPGKPKPDKIPINPRDGSWAKANDFTTWDTYAQAEKYYSADASISGLGFFFSKELPFLGVDLDHCFENGKINNCAFVNASLLDSYTEISQSGEGLHIIGIGKNPGGDQLGRKKGDFEIYSDGRFFALTGNVWENHREVMQFSQVVLQIFYDKYFVKVPVETKVENKFSATENSGIFSPENRSPGTNTVMPKRTGSVNLSDDKIIELLSNAKNSSKFTSLWRGSTSGYNSGSECDLALTSMLSFYTQDVNQLQRLLLKSGLNREKMNRADYMARTINKATSGLTEKFGDRPPVCYFCKKPLPLNVDPKCPHCGKRRRF